MIAVYIIIGGSIFFFIQKLLYKVSARNGWRIFLVFYILVSILCVIYFTPFTEKFTLNQRIGILIAFIIGTVIRIIYYRGRMIPDKKE